MHVDTLLGWLGVLSLSIGALSHAHHDGWNEYPQSKPGLLARERPVSNSTRSASSKQPLITRAPRSSSRVSSTFTTTGTSSSVPSTRTLSGGVTVVAVIGATYVIGAGGATLIIGGVPRTFPAGTIVTITGGGPNGDTPEIQTVSIPTPTPNPRTTGPASWLASSSTPFSPTPTSSGGTTSSSATPSPSGSSTPYIILMSRKATKDEIQSLNITLSKEATPGSLSGITNDRTGLVVFFRANITTSQAGSIGKEPGVETVAADEMIIEEEPPSSDFPASATSEPSATGPPGSPKTSLPNPIDIRLQTDAVDELKVISQPPGARLADLPGYAFASEGGRGITIYVLDSGVNAQNPARLSFLEEWNGMPGSKRYIYTPQATREETDSADHGSCVASKAGGPAYGTAKNVDMVAVKMPSNLPLSSILAGLVEVSSDVYHQRLEGKAILNLSFITRIPKLYESSATAMKLLLISIMMDDIVVVVASGNDRRWGYNNVNSYPALWGQNTDIIVVGAVRNNGVRARFSQGTESQLTVSAPGYVICASGKSTLPRVNSGTSFATPAVAGVIAVWLSQDEYRDRLQVPGKVAANVKAMVQSMAYPRMQGQPAVIWNGIDPRGLACSSSGGGSNARRQAAPSGGSCEATKPTSTSSPATPSPPPKPTWSDNPPGFTKVYEQDGVASANYDATSNSASAGITTNIEQWCLGLCTGPCVSVFLYRVLQFDGSAYDPYYICNQYNKPWSNDFVQKGVSSRDAGVAFNKT